MGDPELDVGDVTRLLQAAHEGEADAIERLLPLVYDDLRRLARRQLGYEYVERTLNPTALVHESYLKLGRPAMAARDRAHFLAIAARAMRQVLVDQARDRKAAKRGGGEWERTTLTDGAWAGEFDPGRRARPRRGARASSSRASGRWWSADSSAGWRSRRSRRRSGSPSGRCIATGSRRGRGSIATSIPTGDEAASP